MILKCKNHENFKIFSKLHLTFLNLNPFFNRFLSLPFDFIFYFLFIDIVMLARFCRIGMMRQASKIVRCERSMTQFDPRELDEIKAKIESNSRFQQDE